MKRTLALLLLLAGCSGPDSPEILAKNQSTLSGRGLHVGTLPDGRDVTRYEIDRGTQTNHFIYVVNGSVSTNRVEPHGKTVQLHTEVVIDGIVYRPESNRKAEKE